MMGEASSVVIGALVDASVETQRRGDPYPRLSKYVAVGLS